MNFRKRKAGPELTVEQVKKSLFLTPDKIEDENMNQIKDDCDNEVSDILTGAEKIEQILDDANEDNETENDESDDDLFSDAKEEIENKMDETENVKETTQKKELKQEEGEKRGKEATNLKEACEKEELEPDLQEDSDSESGNSEFEDRDVVDMIFDALGNTSTLPQKKRNFNFQIFHGDPGPGSVTPGHVHQGNCSWEQEAKDPIEKYQAALSVHSII